MSLNAAKPQGGEQGHSTHLASSFTDLMASMMVIFILLFVSTLNNSTKQRQTVVERLLGALQSALDAAGVSTGGVTRDDRDPFAVVIVTPEQLLFNRGEEKVQPEGSAFLAKLIPVLSTIVCSSERVGQIESIVVEGHTDTTWLGTTADQDGPEMNLELSQKRSMDVVKIGLLTLKGRADRDCFRQLISASGRGQEELMPGYPGEDAKQRRVVFKIRTRQETVGQLAAGLAPIVASPATAQP